MSGGDINTIWNFKFPNRPSDLYEPTSSRDEQETYYITLERPGQWDVENESKYVKDLSRIRDKMKNIQLIEQLPGLFFDTLYNMIQYDQQLTSHLFALIADTLSVTTSTLVQALHLNKKKIQEHNARQAERERQLVSSGKKSSSSTAVKSNDKKKQQQQQKKKKNRLLDDDDDDDDDQVLNKNKNDEPSDSDNDDGDDNMDLEDALKGNKDDYVYTFQATKFRCLISMLVFLLGRQLKNVVQRLEDNAAHMESDKKTKFVKGINTTSSTAAASKKRTNAAAAKKKSSQVINTDDENSDDDSIDVSFSNRRGGNNNNTGSSAGSTDIIWGKELLLTLQQQLNAITQSLYQLFYLDDIKDQFQYGILPFEYCRVTLPQLLILFTSKYFKSYFISQLTGRTAAGASGSKFNSPHYKSYCSLFISIVMNYCDIGQQQQQHEYLQINPNFNNIQDYQQIAHEMLLNGFIDTFRANFYDHRLLYNMIRLSFQRFNTTVVFQLVFDAIQNLPTSGQAAQNAVLEGNAAVAGLLGLSGNNSSVAQVGSMNELPKFLGLLGTSLPSRCLKQLDTLFSTLNSAQSPAIRNGIVELITSIINNAFILPPTWHPAEKKEIVYFAPLEYQKASSSAENNIANNNNNNSSTTNSEKKKSVTIVEQEQEEEDDDDDDFSDSDIEDEDEEGESDNDEDDDEEEDDDDDSDDDNEEGSSKKNRKKTKLSKRKQKQQEKQDAEEKAAKAAAEEEEKAAAMAKKRNKRQSLGFDLLDKEQQEQEEKNNNAKNKKSQDDNNTNNIQYDKLLTVSPSGITAAEQRLTLLSTLLTRLHDVNNECRVRAVQCIGIVTLQGKITYQQQRLCISALYDRLNDKNIKVRRFVMVFLRLLIQRCIHYKKYTYGNVVLRTLSAPILEKQYITKVNEFERLRTYIAAQRNVYHTTEQDLKAITTNSLKAWGNQEDMIFLEQTNNTFKAKKLLCEQILDDLQYRKTISDELRIDIRSLEFLKFTTQTITNCLFNFILPYFLKSKFTIEVEESIIFIIQCYDADLDDIHIFFNEMLLQCWNPQVVNLIAQNFGLILLKKFLISQNLIPHQDQRKKLKDLIYSTKFNRWLFEIKDKQTGQIIGQRLPQTQEEKNIILEEQQWEQCKEYESNFFLKLIQLMLKIPEQNKPALYDIFNVMTSKFNGLYTTTTQYAIGGATGGSDNSIATASFQLSAGNNINSIGSGGTGNAKSITSANNAAISSIAEAYDNNYILDIFLNILHFEYINYYTILLPSSQTTIGFDGTSTSNDEQQQQNQQQQQQSLLDNNEGNSNDNNTFFNIKIKQQYKTIFQQFNNLFSYIITQALEMLLDSYVKNDTNLVDLAVLFSLVKAMLNTNIPINDTIFDMLYMLLISQHHRHPYITLKVLELLYESSILLIESKRIINLIIYCVNTIIYSHSIIAVPLENSILEYHYTNPIILQQRSQIINQLANDNINEQKSNKNNNKNSKKIINTPDDPLLVNLSQQLYNPENPNDIYVDKKTLQNITWNEFVEDIEEININTNTINNNNNMNNQQQQDTYNQYNYSTLQLSLIDNVLQNQNKTTTASSSSSSSDDEEEEQQQKQQKQPQDHIYRLIVDNTLIQKMIFAQSKNTLYYTQISEICLKLITSLLHNNQNHTMQSPIVLYQYIINHLNIIFYQPQDQQYWLYYNNPDYWYGNNGQHTIFNYNNNSNNTTPMLTKDEKEQNPILNGKSNRSGKGRNSTKQKQQQQEEEEAQKQEQQQQQQQPKQITQTIQLRNFCIPSFCEVCAFASQPIDTEDIILDDVQTNPQNKASLIASAKRKTDNGDDNKQQRNNNVKVNYTTLLPSQCYCGSHSRIMLPSITQNDGKTTIQVKLSPGFSIFDKTTKLQYKFISQQERLSRLLTVAGQLALNVLYIIEDHEALIKQVCKKEFELGLYKQSTMILHKQQQLRLNYHRNGGQLALIDGINDIGNYLLFDDSTSTSLDNNNPRGATKRKSQTTLLQPKRGSLTLSSSRSGGNKNLFNDDNDDISDNEMFSDSENDNAAVNKRGGVSNKKKTTTAKKTTTRRRRRGGSDSEEEEEEENSDDMFSSDDEDEKPKSSRRGKKTATTTTNNKRQKNKNDNNDDDQQQVSITGSIQQDEDDERANMISRAEKHIEDNVKFIETSLTHKEHFFGVIYRLINQIMSLRHNFHDVVFFAAVKTRCLLMLISPRVCADSIGPLMHVLEDTTKLSKQIMLQYQQSQQQNNNTMNINNPNYIKYNTIDGYYLIQLKQIIALGLSDAAQRFPNECAKGLEVLNNLSIDRNENVSLYALHALAAILLTGMHKPNRALPYICQCLTSTNKSIVNTAKALVSTLGSKRQDQISLIATCLPDIISRFVESIRATTNKKKILQCELVLKELLQYVKTEKEIEKVVSGITVRLIAQLKLHNVTANNKKEKQMKNRIMGNNNNNDSDDDGNNNNSDENSAKLLTNKLTQLKNNYVYKYTLGYFFIPGPVLHRNDIQKLTKLPTQTIAQQQYRLKLLQQVLKPDGIKIPVIVQTDLTNDSIIQTTLMPASKDEYCTCLKTMLQQQGNNNGNNSAKASSSRKSLMPNTDNTGGSSGSLLKCQCEPIFKVNFNFITGEEYNFNVLTMIEELEQDYVSNNNNNNNNNATSPTTILNKAKAVVSATKDENKLTDHDYTQRCKFLLTMLKMVKFNISASRRFFNDYNAYSKAMKSPQLYRCFKELALHIEKCLGLKKAFGFGNAAQQQQQQDDNNDQAPAAAGGGRGGNKQTIEQDFRDWYDKMERDYQKTVQAAEQQQDKDNTMNDDQEQLLSSSDSDDGNTNNKNKKNVPNNKKNASQQQPPATGRNTRRRQQESSTSSSEEESDSDDDDDDDDSDAPPKSKKQTAAATNNKKKVVAPPAPVARPRRGAAASKKPVSESEETDDSDSGSGDDDDDDSGSESPVPPPTRGGRKAPAAAKKAAPAKPTRAAANKKTRPPTSSEEQSGSDDDDDDSDEESSEEEVKPRRGGGRAAAAPRGGSARGRGRGRK